MPETGRSEYMGIPVLILGESGSGKSTSLRNFTENEVGIFNVAGKPLPFRKKLPKANNARYDTILKTLSKPNLKTYVIDDSQYLMAFEAFDRAKETGYGKFTDMALHFRNLIDFVVRYTPPDVIVYFLHHTEKADDGRLKAKTQGKMLDSQLTVEGLFSIVLLCVAEGPEHYFLTNSDGTNPAKSPMDMFEEKMDNDLKLVDTTIREYWELNGGKEDEEH
nr:MAG TPA: AAA domain protein [Caudoviricetes sp.]